jgi:hypothetical protein
LPADIPANPDVVYEDTGWTNWGDWLGTGNVSTANRQYLTFEEAKKHVRGLGLKDVAGWKHYCNSGQRPNNIPSNPNSHYKNGGWKNWPNWLGTNRTPHHYNFLPFAEARDQVRRLKLNDIKDWSRYCKSGQKPDGIPSRPDDIYENNGWISWGDWLGTGSVANKDRQFLSFEKAREFVRGLNLDDLRAWRYYCKCGKRPSNIPSAPNEIYKNRGWISWGDWVGTGSVSTSKREWRQFEKARIFISSLKLGSSCKWESYCKSGQKPVDIPSAPNRVYKGWKGWNDWLGTSKIQKKHIES